MAKAVAAPAADPGALKNTGIYGKKANSIDSLHFISLKSSTTSPLDEENIEKAEAFLLSREIQDLHIAVKRKYLEKKARISSREIDLAVDRVVGIERIMSDNDSKSQIQSLEFGANPHHGYQIDQTSDHPYQDGHSGREDAIVSSTVLGVSIGVFSLAVLRWLNGGDFVLLRPTRSSSTHRNLAAGSNGALLNPKEEVADKSGLQQQDEGGLLQDIANYVENESKSDHVVGTKKSLYETHDTRQFQRRNSQELSYKDLTLAIRALSSDIYYRSNELESANRAMAASLTQKDTSTITSLLTEVSADLSQLKQSILHKGKVNENYTRRKVYLGKTNQREADEIRDKDPSKQIMEKASGTIPKLEKKNNFYIQKMAALVEDGGPNETEIGGPAAKEYEGAIALRSDSRSFSTESTATSTSPSIQSDNSKGSNEHALTNEQLAVVLKRLATESNITDIKTVCHVLYLHCLNISKNPSDLRYHKIFEEIMSAQEETSLSLKSISTIASLLTADSAAFSDNFAHTKVDSGDPKEAFPSKRNNFYHISGTIPKSVAVFEDGVSNATSISSPNAKENEGAVENDSMSISTELTATSTSRSIETHKGCPQQIGNHLHQSNENSSTNAELTVVLKRLATKNNPTNLKAGARVLYLHCLNISKNPSDTRYHRIYINTDAFRNKVGNLVGGTEFLCAIGFVERVNFFEWKQPERLNFALAALEFLMNGSITIKIK